MVRRTLFLAVVLILALSVMSNASGINVLLGGVEVAFTEESGFPFIDDANRTQVPFRVVLEQFGAMVEWDAKTRTAIATKDGIEVKVPIGEKYIYKNGVKMVNDTEALVKDGRTYLPIRSVMEAFGMDGGWDAASSRITINYQVVDAKPVVQIYSTDW